MAVILPWIFLLLLSGLSACGPTSGHRALVRIAEGPPYAWEMAPVKRIEISRTGTYRIQPGDTLYAIAMVHGLDVADLAHWNNIQDPDLLWVDQKISLTSLTKTSRNRLNQEPQKQESQEIQKTRTPKVKPKPKVKVKVKPKVKPKGHTPSLTKKTPRPKPKPKVRKVPSKKVKKKSTRRSKTLSTKAPRRWQWPVKGRLLNKFGKHGARRNTGIDIAAPKGSPVRAAASGVVAYADNGVKGYGHLVIVRHGGSFMTAYAHNQTVLVKQGSFVRIGQVIARVGQSGRVSSPRLHFELRKGVKPVNPTQYLSKL